MEHGEMLNETMENQDQEEDVAMRHSFAKPVQHVGSPGTRASWTPVMTLSIPVLYLSTQFCIPSEPLTVLLLSTFWIQPGEKQPHASPVHH